MSDREYIQKYISREYWDESFQKLKQGIPVQYIVGNVDFYGRIFDVNEHVLIPRFETELLVQKVVEYSKQYFDRKVSILDIGTGSGCIAITLKKEIDCVVDALDISKEALEVAKNNAKKNKADVHFMQSDLFENVHKTYDIIISNPPYLSKEDDVMDIVDKNEPHQALYADHDGYEIYERIFKDIHRYVKNKTLIAFEIGERQKETLEKMCKQIFKNCSYSFEKDYTNRYRYLFIFYDEKV